jgi:peptidoglycan/xylan/chitin deacetylase (PgdA/CDA1 family)
MKFVSPFLKKVVYPSLSMAGVFRRASSPGLAIVTYHGVLPPGYEPVDSAFDGNLISAETLRRQLRLLKSHFNVISPEGALAWLEGRSELPRRAVLITCDDGLLNHLTDMLPVLQQEGLRCLFFVTGISAKENDPRERSMLWYEELFLLLLRAPDGKFQVSCEGLAIAGELGSREQTRATWWNCVQELSRLAPESRTACIRILRKQFGLQAQPGLDLSNGAQCRRFGLMNADEIRELAAAGMTIGAHTVSHPILSQAPAALARGEITECKAQIEAVLQQEVWAFAYPFGDAQSVTPEVLAMADGAGYTAAFLNYGGGLGMQLPAHALPRIHVTAEMSLAELDAHVSGFYARLQRLVGRGGPA